MSKGDATYAATGKFTLPMEPTQCWLIVTGSDGVKHRYPVPASYVVPEGTERLVIRCGVGGGAVGKDGKPIPPKGRFRFKGGPL